MLRYYSILIYLKLKEHSVYTHFIMAASENSKKTVLAINKIYEDPLKGYDKPYIIKVFTKSSFLHFTKSQSFFFRWDFCKEFI